MGYEIVIYAWAIGLLLLGLVIWGTIRFSRRKQYIRAGICWIILLSVAISYGLYEYSEFRRINLLKRVDQPVRNSLIPDPTYIPPFLVKSFDYFNGFDSASAYVYPEDINNPGRPPKMSVKFYLFNEFKDNCKAQHDFNTFDYGRTPTELITSSIGQEARFYSSNNNDFPTMKISVDDEFGCLEISAEKFSKDLTKNHLINILNSMIRVP